MQLQSTKTLLTALLLVSALWLVPSVSADDDWWRSRQDSYRPSDTDRYYDSNYRRDRYSGRYDDSDRNDGRIYDKLRDKHEEQHNKLENKYDRKMDRLTEKEQKALRKANRKHDGDIANPRFQERQGEIAEKYARKRNKVERNLGERHREGHRDLTKRYENYYD
jgi:hypothetical protein